MPRSGEEDRMQNTGMGSIIHSLKLLREQADLYMLQGQYRDAADLARKAIDSLSTAVNNADYEALRLIADTAPFLEETSEKQSPAAGA